MNLPLPPNELDAQIAQKVFDQEVGWRWCQLVWNPSGEDWWQEVEDYMDYLATAFEWESCLSIHPCYRDNDWSPNCLRVDEGWRDHVADYHLLYLPCPIFTCEETGDKYYGDPIPPYSSDIVAAWEIVNKSLSTGDNSFELTYFNGTWYASVNHSDAVADTASEAICRAALR